MNTPFEDREAMVRAALSLRAAKGELSAQQIQRIALFACRANDMLAFFAEAASRAVALGVAIEPQGLLDTLKDNDLILKELSNGQITETENQGRQSAGAADH